MPSVFVGVIFPNTWALSGVSLTLQNLIIGLILRRQKIRIIAGGLQNKVNKKLAKIMYLVWHMNASNTKIQLWNGEKAHLDWNSDVGRLGNAG